MQWFILLFDLIILISLCKNIFCYFYLLIMYVMIHNKIQFMIRKIGLLFHKLSLNLITLPRVVCCLESIHISLPFTSASVDSDFTIGQIWIFTFSLDAMVPLSSQLLKVEAYYFCLWPLWQRNSWNFCFIGLWSVLADLDKQFWPWFLLHNQYHFLN